MSDKSDKIPSDYRAAVEYIEELPRFTKKHSLEHTKQFLGFLGNPAADRKVIHVAGTNGKGSVCAYIQAILESEGKRTGFFTSPHLLKINERIQIGRKPVEDDDFFRVFVKAMKAVEKMRGAGLEHPSYFEFLFGMGMLCFAESDAEYIILETGLGGRLDATNAYDRPYLTVITSISLDHTDILGDTIEQIAYEKAGIIKKGIPVFFDGSCERAGDVIRREAKKKQAPCREISNHAFEIQEACRNYIAFSRNNAYDKDRMWRVPICGIYQVMNAEIALQAAEYALKGQEAHRDRWADAVAAMKWEGRMETAAPHLMVDGAHNPGAVAAFAESMGQLEPEGGELPVVIFSAVSDKKYEQMIACLCREVKAKAYIATEVDDRRKVMCGELKAVFERYTSQPVYERASAGQALKTAYEIRGEGEIYCLGSLYLAGEIKRCIQEESGDVRFCRGIKEISAKP
mgnify:FL=1